MKIDSKFILKVSADLKEKREIETDKLDFKRDWYKLSDKKSPDRIEICKDICAIANTVGLEGYIFIGIDKKTGELFDQPFSYSGLRDETELLGILVKNIDDYPPEYYIEQIEVEDEGIKKIISVIKLPPSLTKPHVIKNWKDREHYIPYRKGTSTIPATKYHLDLMYYDRKNIEPDYDLSILKNDKKLTFNSHADANNFIIDIRHPIVIQNTGKKPIAIKAITLHLNVESINGTELKYVAKIKDIIDSLNLNYDTFTSKQWIDIPDISQITHTFSYHSLIIPSNEMKQIRMKFSGLKRTFAKDGTDDREYLNKVFLPALRSLKKYEYYLRIETVNNLVFISDKIEICDET